MKSGSNCNPINYDAACADIRDIVAAFRRIGAKTLGGLYEATRLTGICERRAYTLFFQDRYAAVCDEERRLIRVGAIQAHRELAVKHRALAAECDAIADTKEAALTFGNMTDVISGKTGSEAARGYRHKP